MIGSNDEPNGHGTVWVNWPELNKLLKEKDNMMEVKKLTAFLNLTNLYVGDAICNMLMCEAAMRDLDMSIEDFKNLYTELPSRMFKCQVYDRFIFETIEDESRLKEPVAVQEMID